MALGKIRRWNNHKSGDGSICAFRRWLVIFACVFGEAISAFRRWVRGVAVGVLGIVHHRRPGVAVAAGAVFLGQVSQGVTPRESGADTEDNRPDPSNFRRDTFPGFDA